MVVKEDFINNLYSNPTGKRADTTIPTLFDEIRWSSQHSQKPLEQVLQLIGELHGPFMNINPNVANLLNVLLSLFSNKDNKNVANQVKTALSALNSVITNSTIGRKNGITANQMSVPQLREFISKSQAVHPSVNAYIQNNIGKYPYFQQISEQVGSLGQIVLTSKDIHPIKRIEIGGKDSMQTDYPIRRNVDQKIFKNVSTLIDASDSLVNCLFLRAMKPDGNNAILLGDQNTTVSHGYSFTMDTQNAERNKKAVAPCLAKAVQRFGPVTQLLNSFFPVEYQVKLQPELYEITTEGGVCYVDKLNRPITREIPIPVAKEENVVEIA
jgi:hypothetical protein